MLGVRARRIGFFVIAILVVIVLARPFESDSAASTLPRILIQQRITMGLNDSQSAFPPVPVSGAEQVQLTDAASVVPPEKVTARETVLLGDTAGVFPSEAISTSETVRLTDTTGVFPPLSIVELVPVTMTDTVSIDILVTLTVEGAGRGGGQVTNGGIVCQIDAGVTSGSCAEGIIPGTTVFLDASPDTGSEFGGWAGCDVGGSGPTCIVVVNDDTAITARFEIAGEVIVSPIVDSPARVEAPFRVDVVADEVQDLAGAQASIGYDPTVLRFIGVRPGPDLADCSNQVLDTGSTVNLAMVCGGGRSGLDLVLEIMTFIPMAGTLADQTTIAVAEVEIGNDGDPVQDIPAFGESTVVDIVLGACGDLNHTGVVNIVDMITVSKAILGTLELTDTQKILADLDSSGRIEVIDLIIGLQFIVGLVPELDECGPPPNGEIVLSN